MANRSWSPCENICSEAKRKKDAEKKALNEKNEREETKRRSDKEKKIVAAAGRIVAAANAADVPANTEIKTRCYSSTLYSINELRGMANGVFEKDSYINTDLTFIDTKTVAETAKTLHCSTDYLLGLSDDLNGGGPPAWRSADSRPKDGQLVILLKDISAGTVKGYSVELARFNGDDYSPYNAPNVSRPWLTLKSGTRWLSVEEV